MWFNAIRKNEILAKNFRIYSTQLSLLGEQPGQGLFSVCFSKANYLKKQFLWLSLGSNQYSTGRVYELCVYFMMGAPEGSTESGSGEAVNRKPILTNISLLLGKPSDQGLFIHCFAFPKLDIIQPNIINSQGTKVAYHAKTHIFCTRKVYGWNFVY